MNRRGALETIMAFQFTPPTASSCATYLPPSSSLSLGLEPDDLALGAGVSAESGVPTFRR